MLVKGASLRLIQINTCKVSILQQGEWWPCSYEMPSIFDSRFPLHLRSFIPFCGKPSPQTPFYLSIYWLRLKLFGIKLLNFIGIAHEQNHVFPILEDFFWEESKPKIGGSSISPPNRKPFRTHGEGVDPSNNPRSSPRGKLEALWMWTLGSTHQQRSTLPKTNSLPLKIFWALPYSQGYVC